MIEAALEEIGYTHSVSGEKLRLLRGSNEDIAAELYYLSMSSPEKDDQRVFSSPAQALKKITDLGDKALFLSLVSEEHGMVGAAWVIHNSRKSRNYELTPGIRVYDQQARGHGLGSFMAEYLHDIVDRDYPTRLAFVTASNNQVAFEFAADRGYHFDDKAPMIGKIKMFRPKTPKS